MTNSSLRRTGLDRAFLAPSVTIALSLALSPAYALPAAMLAPPASAPGTDASKPAPKQGGEKKSEEGKGGAAKGAPAQPEGRPAGQSTPTGTGSAPGLPDGPVVESGKPDPSLAARPGDVIDPAAKAILDRAEKASMDLRVLEMVTEYRAKMLDGSQPPVGSVVPPAKVLVQYNRRDAFSMPRMRVEPADASSGGMVVIFDGDGSAVLDLERKLWFPTRTGFAEEAQPALLSLPAWIVDRRSKGLIKARNGGKVRPGGNELVAARVLGTEVLDGEECDLVTSAIAFRLFEDGEESQINPGPPKYARMFETVAFARKDGLPRRIHTVAEVPGLGPNGNEERTVLYTNVKVDAPLPDVAFGLAKPEGFSDGTAAKPATPEAPSGAPATPPAK